MGYKMIKIYSTIQYAGLSFVVTGIRIEDSPQGKSITICGLSPELAEVFQKNMIEQGVIHDRVVEVVRKMLDDDSDQKR